MSVSEVLRATLCTLGQSKRGCEKLCLDFQDPCVLEDLDGRVLVYEPRAVIIHLGESPLAGHYRTYLLPSKLLTDDFTGATSAKPADLSLIGSSAYLVLLVLQV